MADSAVAVTAGTGTNIDTRTEGTNGHHRQVVVLGDPATNAGVAPVDATNGLAVDVKVSALPTGAATSAKQDTGNTSLGTIAGAVSGAEMQVDVVSSALPSGASTAAKQPALGTAGSASSDVITVQGITSMTPLVVDGSGVTQPVSGTFWQATQPVSLDSVPSHAVTNAGTFAVQVDGSALTALQLIDDTVATTASAIPSKGQAVSGTDGTNARVLKTDTSGELQVDVLTMPTTAVTQSGTWDEVGINDSGNSITVDQPTGSNLHVVVDAGTSAVGKLLPPDVDVTAHTNYARKYYTSAGAATDGIIWSPAAGKRWHVVGLYINVSAAATVTLEDDKAGGDDPVFKSEFAANSGVFLTFPEKYPMASGEDAADLLITTSAGNVYVTAVGYEV